MAENSGNKETFFMHNPSEKVNAEYIADVRKYESAPVAPCDKAKALKLLKRFTRKEFPVFWHESISEYLPAVSEGTMKLAEKIYSHDEAIRHAKELISTLDVKELARAFLYGVAHNAPEFRTALACYYYIKNLPKHEFRKKFIGTNATGDVYSENTCEVCQYNSRLSEEPKMQFWHINVDMDFFYIKALVPFTFRLNTAIIYLEEYLRLPTPNTSVEDYRLFKQIIELIEGLPDNATSSVLRKELKLSKLTKMTIEQLESFVDMLGYLNILHTDDSFGVTHGHTNEKDMLPPLSERSYYAYPVNRWRRSCGIDYEMIDFLFKDLY